MYDYEQEKKRLFTDEGQRELIRVRDHVMSVLKISGAITMLSAMRGSSGDSWKMMAYVDRLVELGDISEVFKSHDTPGQYRIFVPAKERT